MPEIVEVFEDFGNNTKKLFKNKKFLLLAGGVGVAALVAGYLKNRDSDTEAVSGFDAIGYAGYPTIGGGSSVGSDSSSEQSYDTTFDALFTNIDDLSERLLKAEETTNKALEEMQRQNDIAQMKANSELYGALGAPEYAGIRESLKAENQQIAEKYGFEFDEGNWYDGNSLVYMPSSQQASVIKKTGLSGANDTFVNNANYAAARVSEAETYQNYESEKVATTVVNSSGGTKVYTTDKETGKSSVYAVADDNKVIELTNGVTSPGTKESSKTPSMSRDTSRAGQTISTGAYTITYDENGYAVSKVKNK